jgi:hypothetical protein
VSIRLPLAAPSAGPFAPNPPGKSTLGFCPPFATNSSAMNVVMPVNPATPQTFATATESSGDIQVVKGYIAVEAIKWTVCFKNPLATPQKLMSLARQCKNHKYADCMLLAQTNHTTFATRIKKVKHTFSKMIGKRLSKKLGVHPPRVVAGKCKVGKSKVHVKTIEPLLAYHHIKTWRLEAVKCLDDNNIANKLLGAVVCLETLKSQTL